MAASLNDRVARENRWARVCWGAGAAAAVTGALLLLWPRGDLFAAGAAADGESAMVEVGGHF
jgi:hypothetical protein